MGRSFFNPIPDRPSHHHRPYPYRDNSDFEGFGPHHHRRGPQGPFDPPGRFGPPSGPPFDFDFSSSDESDDDCERNGEEYEFLVEKYLNKLTLDYFEGNRGHKHHHHRQKHGHHHNHGKKTTIKPEIVKPTTETKPTPEEKPIVEDISGDSTNPSTFVFTSGTRRTTTTSPSSTGQNIKTTTPLFDVRFGTA